jgi:hypothetical protein
LDDDSGRSGVSRPGDGLDRGIRIRGAIFSEESNQNATKESNEHTAKDPPGLVSIVRGSIEIVCVQTVLIITVVEQEMANAGGGADKHEC